MKNLNAQLWYDDETQEEYESYVEQCHIDECQAYGYKEWLDWSGRDAVPPSYLDEYDMSIGARQ